MKTRFWHFSRTQKALLVVFVLGFFLSSLGLLWNFYRDHTVSFPAEGGTFTEGAVAVVDPNFVLNPLFVTGNNKANSVEAGISRLIFSGLMKFEAESGEIIDHLADHTLSEDKTEYTFTLKEGLTWHDGTPLTADDVIFTYQTVIQNPEFSNKNLHETFKNVTIEKIDDQKVKFTLPNPYKFFLTNFTIGLVPKHLLESTPVNNLHLNGFSQNPVGSGPYRFKQLVYEENSPIVNIELEAFPEYISGKPKIATIEFKLFPNDDLLKRNMSGLDALHPKQKDQYAFLEEKNQFELYDFTLPQYVAVFINMDSPKFNGEEKKKTRLALQLATDKDEILNIVPGKRIDTPLLETDTTEWLFEYDTVKAMGALKDSGWYLPTNPPEDNSEGEEEAPENEGEEAEEETASLHGDTLHAAANDTLEYIYHPGNTGIIWTTVEKDFILGKFPPGTTKVTVNKYRLKLFDPKKGRFSYRISTEIGTLKKGENNYTVEFFAGSKKLGEESVTIHLVENKSDIPEDGTVANPPETDPNPPEEEEEEEEEVEETPEEVVEEVTEEESEEEEPAEEEAEEETSEEEINEDEEEGEEVVEEIPVPEEIIFPEHIRRNENGEPLQYTLVTVKSPSFYPEIAEALKRQWEQVGIYTTVEALDQDEFVERVLVNKDYDLLLYGQNLGYNLDAFPFWHFSQADEGSNLSKYRNFEAGILLEEIRQTHDPDLRNQRLVELRDIIKNDVPAIFLFSPYYTLPIDPKVKNVNLFHITLLPDRFSDIEHWYVRESRTFHPEKSWTDFFPWFIAEIKNVF